MAHSDKGVRAKKHLGQHFLKDEGIAKDIADCLSYESYNKVLEIGPGTGVLTKHVLRKGVQVTAMELDGESVIYLKHSFPIDHQKIVNSDNFKVLETDFLQHDLSDVYGDCEFAIIGNYPYNISTQIVFKMLDYRNQVLEFGGMFQKEVAQRICAPHGSKTYGILSVLAQAYYDAEYLFTVPPGAFNPPPKVHSGVLILKRKDNFNQLGCSYKKLKQVVKLAFGQRRKTLRNSLKSLQLDDDIRESEIMSRRPEQISVEEFIGLTKQIFPNQEV